MYYIHTQPSGPSVYPFTLSDLRRSYPNVSFPEALSDDEAAKFDCFRVSETEPPTAPSGKRTVRSEPVQEDSQWLETWALVDITPEETEAQWSAIRSDRNKRLSDCDWTQLPDAPVDAAIWATYRQALRDITEQTDPFNITWPKEP